MSFLNKLQNKIFKNSLWMIIEKLISFFGLIFVSSFVAKYLGPENFGKITYATTLFALVQTIAIWGSDIICSKRLSQKPHSGIKLLFAIRYLRNSVFFLFCIPVLIYIYFSADLLSLFFTSAIAIATYIFIQDIYTIYNDINLNSKNNVFANIIGILVALILRFFIAYLELDPKFLVIPIISLAFIPFIIKRIIFIKNNTHSISLHKKEKIKYTKYMFFAGSSLVISTISVSVYVNISQFFLGTFSKYNLGIYAVALTLGSSWGFINLSFITSFTPKLYQSATQNEAAIVSADIARILIGFTFIYFLFFYFFGNQIIHILYGSEYAKAYEVVLFIIIGTLLSHLGIIYERFTIYLKGYTFLMYKTLATSFIGIILSFLLIKNYSIQGAALSFVILELLSITILNYAFKNMSILKAQVKIFYRK